MPSAWTAAGLAFQVSDRLDGTYLPVYDSNSGEQIVEVEANRAIAFNRAVVTAQNTGTFTPIRIFNFVKVRSTVNQDADRLLKLVLVARH